MRDIPPEGATILAFKRPQAAPATGPVPAPVAFTQTGKPLALVGRGTPKAAPRTIHLFSDARPPILAISNALTAQNVPLTVASFTAVAVATGKQASLVLPHEADLPTLIAALAVHKVRLTF